MKIILNLEEGKNIKEAAEAKYEKMKRKNDEEEEKINFLKKFLEEANFQELERLGMNGKKDEEILVREENEDFVISKTWRSVLSS